MDKKEHVSKNKLLNQPEEKNKTRLRASLESLGTIALRFVVVFAILRFFGFTVVVGQSMEPTFREGDIVFMQTVGNTYRKGDCIVFAHSYDNGGDEHLIKRIAAVAGDMVDCDPETSELFVNGKSLFIPDIPIDPDEITEFPLVVPDGYVFAVGDNYNHSTDSRYKSVGLVSEKNITGKVKVQLTKGKLPIIVKNTAEEEP